MNISYNCAMPYENHTVKIAELARSEGGIFTSAQAVRFGIPPGCPLLRAQDREGGACRSRRVQDGELVGL